MLLINIKLMVSDDMTVKATRAITFELAGRLASYLSRFEYADMRLNARYGYPGEPLFADISQELLLKLKTPDS